MDDKTPEYFLRSALRYLGSHYGGTLAHHLISVALKILLKEGK